jgi:putative ABC transport system ATP-binding protein
MKPMLDVQHVSKVYGKGRQALRALDDVSLRVDRGEFVALIGPSGSGKTSLLLTMGGLLTPSSGKVLVDGASFYDIGSPARTAMRLKYCGFMFQTFHLIPYLTALENVELPLIYRGLPSVPRREQAQQALATVGLEGWEAHTPGELSGGQQQRVAIARAVVTDPEVLLADEPTGNLDSASSREIMELLSALNRDRGITIVMVTHDPDMAVYAERRVHFRDGLIDTGLDAGF